MFTLLFKLLRIFPLILGLIFFLKRGGKKNDDLDDGERNALRSDIEALTAMAESGESDERKNRARETAERLRAVLARQQVNQGAFKDYRSRRKDFGATIPGNAATDKDFDDKLKDLQDAAGKLAGAG